MVYSTNYVQDGAASNNREFGGSMNLSGLEAVGEVRVETSTSNAKYSSPASVIVTTRGGGNTPHNALCDYSLRGTYDPPRSAGYPPSTIHVELRGVGDPRAVKQQWAQEQARQSANSWGASA